MLRPIPAVVIASALAVGLVACGSSSQEPKRTLDARTEAVRFFPAGTPFIALIDPTPADGDNPATVLQQLAGVPAVAAFARNDVRFAAGQQLDLAQLAPLLDTPDPELGGESTQVAVGVTPTGTPTEDSLVVVVTDDPGRTSARIAHAAPAAGLVPAGALDRAKIYEGGDATVAVRDGVVLIAATKDEVESAIRTRDSDPSGQVDDGRVENAFDELPDDAALHAFVDVGALSSSDPGIDALASGDTGWIGSLGDAGISVAPGDPNEISLVAAIDPADRSTVPLEERPETFDLSQKTMSRASAGEFAPTSGFHDALLHLAPAELSVSATGDELRALVTSRR